MSADDLISLLQNELNTDSQQSSRRERQLKVSNTSNRIFAQNIGNPVYEYLDTIYFERIKKYIEDTYEERIKKLEDKVEALQKKVK